MILSLLMVVPITPNNVWKFDGGLKIFRKNQIHVFHAFSCPGAVFPWPFHAFSRRKGFRGFRVFVCFVFFMVSLVFRGLNGFHELARKPNYIEWNLGRVKNTTNFSMRNNTNSRMVWGNVQDWSDQACAELNEVRFHSCTKLELAQIESEALSFSQDDCCLRLDRPTPKE